MFKTLLLWLFGSFLLLQAIQIDIPEAPEILNPDNEIKAPDKIMSMLRTSCYDCHSYKTKMPWYGHISPISLEVKSHIKNGRSAVNFQEWGTYSEERKQKIYKGIVKTINYRMPMPMYLTLHEQADLTKEERNTIKKWAQSHIRETYY
ncbi:heme-binding domain-containing protein [Sulfurovum sp. ST-21]|uniref:Heme-binding domain-containing protein n=1 Tax=Sulfurovum indicum TaxID=2779528 RepID=A0A7M1S409_9BACT|nr:heme-binding domain-containing protein [Sulfurovum indicum]QOR61731.1 heme-binding domain-containing protein [Sulfurovum indicum]